MKRIGAMVVLPLIYGLIAGRLMQNGHVAATIVFSLVVLPYIFWINWRISSDKMKGKE